MQKRRGGFSVLTYLIWASCTFQLSTEQEVLTKNNLFGDPQPYSLRVDQQPPSPPASSPVPSSLYIDYSDWRTVNTYYFRSLLWCSCEVFWALINSFYLLLLHKRSGPRSVSDSRVNVVFYLIYCAWKHVSLQFIWKANSWTDFEFQHLTQILSFRKPEDWWSWDQISALFVLFFVFQHPRLKILWSEKKQTKLCLLWVEITVSCSLRFSSQSS